MLERGLLARGRAPCARWNECVESRGKLKLRVVHNTEPLCKLMLPPWWIMGAQANGDSLAVVAAHACSTAGLQWFGIRQQEEGCRLRRVVCEMQAQELRGGGCLRLEGAPLAWAGQGGRQHGGAGQHENNSVNSSTASGWLLFGMLATWSLCPEGGMAAGSSVRAAPLCVCASGPARGPGQPPSDQQGAVAVVDHLVQIQLLKLACGAHGR